MTTPTGGTSASQSTVSRRSLARGAAWSAPLILATAAAPAFAASPCDPRPYTMSLNTTNYKRASNTSGSGTATTPVAGKTPLTYTITTTTTGGKTLGSNNATVSGDVNNGYNAPSNGAPLNANGFQLQQSGGTQGYASRQTTTITFSRPVTGLTFTIYDIDKAGTANTTSNYQDAVALTPGFTIVSKGSAVTGTGTSSDPFTTTNVGEVAASTPANMVTVKYSGTLSSVSIDFWSLLGTGGQQTFLSQMSGTARGC